MLFSLLSGEERVLPDNSETEPLASQIFIYISYFVRAVLLGQLIYWFSLFEKNDKYFKNNFKISLNKQLEE